MSQQPPYGEPSPYGQNPQNPPGYPPYPGPSPYGTSPYGQGPPKSNTTRNVLIIVGIAVLLLCGGAAAGLVALAGSAKDTITSQLNNDYRGSDDRPLTVSEGDAFSIRGFDYDEGWSVGQNRYDSAAIDKLRVTNARDDESTERVSLTFKFLAGSEILAQVDCRSSADIGFEESLVLSCDSSADVPRGYDTIKVSDSSLFE